ncbi:MAG: DUF1648 domain-containing protein [Acidobacteria bacterium]|nr:DUF1648 domain-containing protein [Acidobacteriota bacterium]
MPTGPWWVVEAAAFGAFVLMLAVVLPSYAGLLETIPSHFHLDGQPDGYGGKWLLIPLLIVGAAVFVTSSMIRTARGEAEGVGRVVPPVFTVSLLATVAAGLYHNSRNVS